MVISDDDDAFDQPAVVPLGRLRSGGGAARGLLRAGPPLQARARRSGGAAFPLSAGLRRMSARRGGAESGGVAGSEEEEELSAGDGSASSEEEDEGDDEEDEVDDDDDFIDDGPLDDADAFEDADEDELGGSHDEDGEVRSAPAVRSPCTVHRAPVRSAPSCWAAVRRTARADGLHLRACLRRDAPGAWGVARRA